MGGLLSTKKRIPQMIAVACTKDKDRIDTKRMYIWLLDSNTSQNLNATVAGRLNVEDIVCRFD